MKNIKLLFLLFSTISMAQNLNLDFAQSYGSANYDIGRAIHNDGLGNTYVCGVFTNAITFNTQAGDVTYESNGYADIFIAKHNNEGLIIWVKRIGGSGNDEAYAISSDALGNVLIAGKFLGSVDFDPGVGSDVYFAGSGNYFALKLDSEGNYEWVNNFAANSNNAYAIAVDASNNVFITGEFKGSLSYNPGTGSYITITSNNDGQGTDAYFAKINGNTGQTIYYKSFTTTPNAGGSIGQKLTIDSNDNLYIVGNLYGTVDFNPNSGQAWLTSTGESDIFVTKLTNSGSFIWAKAMGGPMFDKPRSIAIDSNGHLLVSGEFRGTADFDPSAASYPLTSNGNLDVFIVKLNNSGGFLWAKAFGAIGSDSGASVAVDADDNVYTIGLSGGTIDYVSGDGVFEVTGNGGLDIFIHKQDTDGNFISVNIIGNISSDIPESAMINENSEIFITGSFYGTVDFDLNDGTTNLVSNGSNDVFVVKYNASTLSVPETNLRDLNIKLFPNPSYNKVTISATLPIKNVTLYDVQGKAIDTKTDINSQSIQFDLIDSLKDGIYLIEIEFNDNSKIYRKLIKHN